MLAARGFSSVRSIFVLFALAGLSLPVSAQVPSMEFHGVPPSGIGGANAAFAAARPGHAAALGCCASFFFPSSFSPMVPYPSFGTEQRSRRDHRRHRHDGNTVVAEPVFIPYAVPYAVDAEDGGTDEAEEPEAAGPEPMRTPRSGAREARGESRRTAMRGVPDSSEQEAGGSPEVDPNGASTPEAAPSAPVEPPEQVVAQPSTVLVFKDGHRSEVGNYAIVGDTLFDFSGDRERKILLADLDIAATQKANDAAGVEFRLPPAAN